MRVIYGNLPRKKPKVLRGKKPSKRRRCVATIGVFDGVHLGHKFVLKRVKREATRLKIASLVITFDIPPKKLLSKRFCGYITDREEKRTIIGHLGIDYLWILKNSTSLLNLSGEEFLNYILKYFRINKLIVGEGFRFGRGKKFDVIFLKKISQKYKFNLVVIKKKKKQGHIISSTLIKELIKKGDFKRTKLFLGRNYSLKGRVSKGGGRGQRLGFPTANIHSFDHVFPSSGVYATYTIMGKRNYLSAVNIGIRPTVTDSKELVLESHIINFRRNILGKTVKIVFLEKIREEKKFSTSGKLKEAIRKDIQYILKKYPPKPKAHSS